MEDKRVGFASLTQRLSHCNYELDQLGFVWLRFRSLSEPTSTPVHRKKILLLTSGSKLLIFLVTRHSSLVTCHSRWASIHVSLTTCSMLHWLASIPIPCGPQSSLLTPEPHSADASPRTMLHPEPRPVKKNILVALLITGLATCKPTNSYVQRHGVANG
jgi:hypothetical protein